MALVLAPSASAEKNYGPGVTDTEIKIGQTIPYSGPVSAYGTIGRAQAAYFEMINAKGGVNGRKIRLTSLDDAFSPPKTVEHTRRLVEADNVLLIFSSLGTPTNSAIYKYLNGVELPMLLPGIKMQTSATDYAPFSQLQLQRFDGKQWTLFGSVM